MYLLATPKLKLKIECWNKKNFCLAMEAHRDREVQWDKNRDRIELLAGENSVVAREKGGLKKLIRKETNDVGDGGSDDDDDDDDDVDDGSGGGGGVGSHNNDGDDDDSDDSSSCFLFVRSLQCKREIQRQACP